MHKLIEWMHWLKEWTLHWAVTPFATWALFFNAFAESSFFPVPPDLLLIAMAIANPRFALWYALVCLAGSVTGGMFGYLLGIRGGKPILMKFVKEERIREIHAYFEKYQEWAIGIAGFTPIPYKVFAIAAGVFYVNFWKFVIVTIISRGARFFIVASLIKLFGSQIKMLIDKYFNILSIVFVILLVGGFYIMKHVKVPSITRSQNDKVLESEEGSELIDAKVPVLDHEMDPETSSGCLP